MFAENIEDVRTSVRRHCGDRISDSLTPKTLVNVKYKEQLKDIVDELQAVRACQLLLTCHVHVYVCVCMHTHDMTYIPLFCEQIDADIHSSHPIDGAIRVVIANVCMQGATGARPQKAPSFASDMVTLGDVWLQPTIANGLIQPLRGAKSSAWWKKLPYEFRELVLRDTNGLYDPDGEVYGCPYNWGATVIAVRTDKANSALGGPVNDWKDLYNMALRGKVGMVASTREVVGSVLKGSGVSYNASASRIRATAFGDNERGRTIRDTLDALGGQVRLYTSKPSEGLKALSAGDLWAFVGWSSDLIQYARRSPNITLVAPVSGTSLWADVMTMPTGCPNPRIARPFFDEWCKMMVDPIFCVPSKGIAGGACVSMLTRSTSYVFTTTRTGTGRVANRHHERDPTSPALGTVLENKIVDERTLRKSEFLYPLDAETIGLYRTLLL